MAVAELMVAELVGEVVGTSPRLPGESQLLSSGSAVSFHTQADRSIIHYSLLSAAADNELFQRERVADKKGPKIASHIKNRTGAH